MHENVGGSKWVFVRETATERQKKLDCAYAEVRRLSGLPPKAPWVSAKASKRDWYEQLDRIKPGCKQTEEDGQRIALSETQTE